MFKRRSTERPTWPSAWVGVWQADDGRVLEITREVGGLAVTSRSTAGAPPHESAPLLDKSTKLIERLPAAAEVDRDGRLNLTIEGGTPELGPRLHLYPGADRAPAVGDEPVTAISLHTGTSVGLYDDWEDDQGMPWAYPLTRYAYVGPPRR